MLETNELDRHIAVIGAGTMGAGIAQKYASSGFNVTLVDRATNSLEAAKKNIRAMLEQAIQRKILSPQDVALIEGRLFYTTTLNDIASASLVIEAIYEDFLAKKSLFEALENIVASDAILATNTSSFSVLDLSQGLKHRERFLGLHYFFHPAKNRLVEVIPTPHTAEHVIKHVHFLQDKIKKIIITSKDAPGFVVNRFFVPWLNEAVKMLAEGYSSATIEAAAKSYFTIPMGPFELMNVTGTPITLHAATTLGAQLGDFYMPSPLIDKQVSKAQPWLLSGAVNEQQFNEIGVRLLATVGAIACQLVYEEEVATVHDVELGARVGLLWPQGPFELMNRHLAALKALDSRALVGMAPPKIFTMHVEAQKPFLNPSINVRYVGDIAIITLDRPDSMNALDERLRDELSQVFTKVEADSHVKGIIITGHQRAFMAGADLSFFDRKIANNQIEEIIAFAKKTQELFLAIDKTPKPVVAAISGLALGGGLELALACKKIIATIDAKLGFPETGIGIYPGLGGTQRTPLRVGPELARFLVLTGTLLSGTEAKVIGLIDECSNSDDLIEDALELVKTLLEQRPHKEQPSSEVFKDLRQAFKVPFHQHSRDGHMSERALKALERVGKKAPLAVQAADLLISQASKAHLEKGLALEIAGLEKIFKSEDAKKGIQGAQAKMHVQFSGK